MLQVGHLPAAAQFLLELTNVRVAEDQLVAEHPVLKGQELDLDCFGLAAFELDVGLFDPERIWHGWVGLVVDTALLQFVLVLILFLLAVHFLLARLVQVLLRDQVGQTDREVHVLVECVGHIHVHVFNCEHSALHIVVARGPAFHDACH